MYSRTSTRDQDFSALLRHRYGEPRRTEPRATASSVSLSVDTGDLVLERPLEPAEEEYVVDRAEPPVPKAPDLLTPPQPPEPPQLPGQQEPPSPLTPGALETPAPQTQRPATGAGPQTPTTTPPQVDAPAALAAPAPQAEAPVTQVPAREPSAAAAPTAATTPLPSSPSSGGSGLTDADLAADMQAILGGGLVYDQSIGRVRPRTDTDPAAGSGDVTGATTAAPGAAPSPAPSSAAPTPERPIPDAPDEQSIFDRIAMSMEHANSFDLGTHELQPELQRRFDAFERLDRDRRQSPPPAARPMSARAGAAAPPVPPAEPPLTPQPVAGLRAEDFAAVYEQRVPGRNPGCAGSGATAALAPRVDEQHSVPMYDTGEHVRSGGDLFVDRLVVGRAPGVPFSYGQIIAMPDFYGTVDDLLTADPAELNRLKALIQRNTAYYVGGKTDPTGDISNEQWDTATGDRYMRLAEANYDHFAPASLLGLPGTQTRSDHKQRWEELHRRALTEMQQLVLAHPNASPFPMGPLTVNAFADHFLTDAFAAGHLVNKEVLMNRFKSRFFSGSSLTADANRFFEQVAQRAWTSRVENAMKQLEPTSPPDALCVHGLCAPILPNIRTAGMFATVLQQAAVAEKDKIANLAVKVLHDKLNRDGVDVVNDAGDAWHLTGDGHLTTGTLTIMRRAVDQSAANIDDPSILASNANFDPLVARVWRFTPRPTPAARVVLTRAFDTYTDPTSADFVAATATLIDEQITMLVDALVDSGRMQRGGGI